jgi:6-pyruvoyltetrahydropterin/6-carboxytetrahydropterin synthase
VKVAKSFTFEAAHRLQNHDGKCRGLHGHSYQVEVEVGGPSLVQAGSMQGMVVDFGVLSGWWRVLETSLDHCTLLEYSDPLVNVLVGYARVTQFKNPPTAEHLAHYVREDLQANLSKSLGPDLICTRVRVSETSTSWAEDSDLVAHSD